MCACVGARRFCKFQSMQTSHFIIIPGLPFACGPFQCSHTDPSAPLWSSLVPQGHCIPCPPCGTYMNFSHFCLPAVLCLYRSGTLHCLPRVGIPCVWSASLGLKSYVTLTSHSWIPGPLGSSMMPNT